MGVGAKLKSGKSKPPVITEKLFVLTYIPRRILWDNDTMVFNFVFFFFGGGDGEKPFLKSSINRPPGIEKREMRSG